MSIIARQNLLRWAVCLFVMTMTAACQKENTQELPMDRTKLIQVLADMHTAEAALQTLINETKDSVAEVYYKQIYQIHGVDKATIDEAMHVLQSQPILLQEVYEDLLDTLNRREVEIR